MRKYIVNLRQSDNSIVSGIIDAENYFDAQERVVTTADLIAKDGKSKVIVSKKPLILINTEYWENFNMRVVTGDKNFGVLAVSETFKKEAPANGLISVKSCYSHILKNIQVDKTGLIVFIKDLNAVPTKPSRYKVDNNIFESLCDLERAILVGSKVENWSRFIDSKDMNMLELKKPYGNVGWTEVADNWLKSNWEGYVEDWLPSYDTIPTPLYPRLPLSIVLKAVKVVTTALKDAKSELVKSFVPQESKLGRKVTDEDIDEARVWIKNNLDESEFRCRRGKFNWFDEDMYEYLKYYKPFKDNKQKYISDLAIKKFNKAEADLSKEELQAAQKIVEEKWYDFIDTFSHPGKRMLMLNPKGIES